MALTDLERMILQQADAIRAREAQGVSGARLSTPDGERDYDAEIAFYQQYGTEQQIEQVLAAKEGRDPDWRQPNAVGSFGALVPPDQVRDAASHRPLGTLVQPVRQPSADEVPAEDGTAPVRESDEDVAPYDEWDKPDLQEELRVRELPVSGNKPELVERLRADDAEFARMSTPQVVDGDDTPPV